MEDKENNSYTYTQKIISQVVSDNDKETIKAITRYCEENNVYPNLISEEKLKEVIESGLKNERLQQELSKTNDKLKKIEEYTKLDLKEAEDYMAKYKGTNRELYENWKFAYETDKNILQFIYEIKGDK